MLQDRKIIKRFDDEAVYCMLLEIYFHSGFRMSSATFQQEFDKYCTSAFVRQHQFREYLNKRDWGINLQSGTVTYGNDLNFQIQLLGTESGNTWRWAWANYESSIPDSLLKHVNHVKEYGEKLGIPELITPQLIVTEDEGHRIAIVCSGLLNGLPYYRGQYDNGAVYFVVLNPPSHIFTVDTPFKLIGTILQIFQSFVVSNHQLVCRSFLGDRQFVIVDMPRGFVAKKHHIEIYVYFGETGQLENISTRAM